MKRLSASARGVLDRAAELYRTRLDARRSEARVYRAVDAYLARWGRS